MNYILSAICFINTLAIGCCIYQASNSINIAASAFLFALVVNGLATAYTLHVKKINDDFLNGEDND